MNRLALSQKYMHGSGIEIGAFQHPWPPANGAKVTHVDKASPERLKQAHPDIDLSIPIVQADVFDNGETLETFPNYSQDFILSSHVIEHCEDPIGAMKNWVRVLKPNGMLLLAAPNKEHTFDKKRKPTVLMDLIAYHDLKKRALRESWRAILIERHQEYFEKVDGILDPIRRIELASDRLDKGFDIHYSCWDPASFFEFISFFNHLFQVEHFSPEGHEFLVALRKKS